MTILNLPANVMTDAAPLPAIYENAKAALAECFRIDECWEWANRAEALASYAKQANDDAMRIMADRIQARAVRRCGELLKEIEPSPGIRTDLKPREGAHPRSRAHAARDAGLSEHQRKTALRIANVPAEEFEREIEGNNPPTVTALAERGTVKAPPVVDDLGERTEEEFKAATHAIGGLEYFCKHVVPIPPTLAVRGSTQAERASYLSLLPELVRNWLDGLKSALEETDVQ